jgi:hypothetical protein
MMIIESCERIGTNDLDRETLYNQQCGFFHPLEDLLCLYLYVP